MNFKELIEQNQAYILIGMVAIIAFILVFTIAISIKQHKLKTKYEKFMEGANGKTLEKALLDKFTDIDNLKADTLAIHEELDNIKENLLTTIQKIGIIKYDAFMEMGGKLSFALALLDKDNDGVVINSVHSSREGCYSYLKEIIKGESFLELSAEERQALEQAVKYNTYME